MSEEPHVDIIVVNWNGGQVTRDCLTSLAKISYTDYRIILIDNSSTDGSVAAIRAEFENVTILQMQQNLRFAGGSNKGIRLALEKGTDLILLLNNDTIVDENFLQPLVARAGRGSGIVVPKIYYHDDPELIWFAGGRISFWLGLIEHRGIRETDKGQFDASGETDYATGCCMLVRRQVIEKVGLLDEAYYMYVEDADWSERARRAGFRIVYEPESKIWHRVSSSAGGNLSFFKLKNKLVSQVRFFGRYARWYHWLVIPWAAIPLNAMKALRSRR